MKNRFKIFLAVAALLVIAGGLLARFDAGGTDWPAVTLTELADPGSEVSSASLAGTPRVVNFWGSWCVACREEHPVLQRLGAEHGISLLGINHLDTRDDALRWLDYFGNPYETSLFDDEGLIAATLGIDALPVTLVVDGDGVIRYRHPGVLDNETADAVIVPLVEELNRKR